MDSVPSRLRKEAGNGYRGRFRISPTSGNKLTAGNGIVDIGGHRDTADIKSARAHRRPTCQMDRMRAKSRPPPLIWVVNHHIRIGNIYGNRWLGKRNYSFSCRPWIARTLTDIAGRGRENTGTQKKNRREQQKQNKAGCEVIFQI